MLKTNSWWKCWKCNQVSNGELTLTQIIIRTNKSFLILDWNLGVLSVFGHVEKWFDIFMKVVSKNALVCWCVPKYWVGNNILAICKCLNRSLKKYMCIHPIQKKSFSGAFSWSQMVLTRFYYSLQIIVVFSYYVHIISLKLGCYSHLLDSNWAILSTSIYDLVLIYVCYFHHHHPLTFPQILLISSYKPSYS